MKLLAIGLAVIFAPAPFKSIDLLKAFKTQLPKIRQAHSVPVLLPRSLPLAGAEHFHVYATGGGSRNAWNLELAAARNCGGANACFVASFDARRGGHLPKTSNLKLANDRAYYHPITCGASCSPASLWFVHGGVLYSWQLKGPPTKNTRGVIAALALQAIKAGPR